MPLFFSLAIMWSILNAANAASVEFRLSNKDVQGLILTENSTQLFRKGLPCKFLAHGWFGTASFMAVEILRQSYVSCLNVNVITVDWGDLSINLNFNSASEDTKVVGDAIGQMMVELVRSGVCSLNSTHCVGHSLGAHVCGNAGRYVRKTLGLNIARATGLDPNAILFTDKPFAALRLTPSDADYVDAIHTDSIIGYRTPLAQADFFVNGGLTPQPGCISFKEIPVACSHARAFRVYAESICNRLSFLSTSCVSYGAFKAGQCIGKPAVNMGEFSPPSSAGSYFVETRDSSPYSLT